MTPLQTYYDNLAATMIKKMEKRGFDAYYCPDSKSAVEKALALMPKGSSVSWGGSMTLEETGLQDALTCTDYRQPGGCLGLGAGTCPDPGRNE